MEVINWISNWFKEHCDGDWEHENQIIIQTVDNPGWYIEIDLNSTSLENLVISESEDKSDSDWYFYLIENRRFRASGDPNKLIFLLLIFKELVENHSS